MQKNMVILVLLFLLLTGCKNAGKTPEESAKTIKPTPVYEQIPASDTCVEKRFTFAYQGQTIQYMLIFPAQYTKSADLWPLLVFLHGSSLRGDNLDLVKKYGPTLVAEQSKEFPLVVLAPQCPKDQDWINMPDLLAALLDAVTERYRLDQNRIYLTGMSLGGRGAWVLANKHPKYFAAMAPVAAAKQKLPQQWNKELLSMPIWAFHGDKDTLVPLKTDQARIDDFRAQGGKPQFTILSGRGHSISDIYKKPELYAWFLSKSKN